MRVRIVADDLTGALDTAAPLVALAGPLPVYWPPAQAATGSFALDTESREVGTPAPDWLHALAGAEVAYKKIDSLLRGNTAREVAACLACGHFRSAVIAPAFPAQQRITQGGRQYWRADAALPWQPVACDLGSELRAGGAALRLAASDALEGSGFFLCDAVSEQDLAALVEARGRLEPPVLWCGSAGLARALAGAPPAETPRRLEPPLLIVIGSHHPVTLAQIEALTARMPEVVVRVPPTRAVEPAIREIAQALDRHRRAALWIEVADGTGPEVAGPVFDRILGRARRALPQPGSLIVTGGATLHRLVQVLEAGALLVTGEVLPGIACSRIQGGCWPGCAVVSKSGAFGASDLLIRLADCAKADRPKGDDHD